MSQLKVKLGQFIKVENKNKKFSQNNFYYALQIEDQNGDNQQCVLFTEKEISKATIIGDQSFFAKDLVPGRLNKFVINGLTSFIVKTFDQNQSESILKFSSSLINRSIKRAEKNQQDLTKKSFLTDLFD